jgi:hypothetical protein
MPFGKHRGQPLENIPSDYLSWVLRKAEAADEWLKARIREEMDRRSGRGGAQAHAGAANGSAEARGPPGDLEAVLKAVAKRWFAQCARKYHPDRSLDNGAAMSVINNANELLVQIIDEELRTKRGR